MRWFTNLSTRSKLFAASAPLLFALIAVIVTAFSNLEDQRETDRTLIAMTEFRVALNGQRAALLSAMHLPPGPEQENRLKEVASYWFEGAELQTRLSSGGPAMKKLASLYAQHARTRDEEVIPLVRQQKIAEANALILGIQTDRYDEMRALAREAGKELQAGSDRKYRRAKLVNIALGVGGATLAVLMGLLLNKLIAGPLEQITFLADRIAHGEVNLDFAGDGRTDEVGRLNQAFLRMARWLKVAAGRAQQIAAGDLTAQFKAQSEKDVIGTAFVAMAENLRGIMRQLLDAVNVLASSTNQIMASTAQLASGAAETAAAVTETTTTVEEVKQTSQVSSQKARYVSDRAQQAAEISRTGKQAVDETVKGMTEIRQQMGSVAESILSLSAQSQAIGEIIATVDDLASQSKLLAVNASIEAAKAGDEGKGFGVVAQEVKSLAEQSRQATTQVRGILGEIQKGTSRSVLATEQGTKSVDCGVKQSSSAGEAITKLSASLGEAAQAAAQIAATSQQQFVGMDQVALAMDNIRTASTQTVTSTRQAELAAQQLHDLGLKLKALVEQFKV